MFFFFFLTPHWLWPLMSSRYNATELISCWFVQYKCNTRSTLTLQKNKQTKDFHPEYDTWNCKKLLLLTKPKRYNVCLLLKNLINTANCPFLFQAPAELPHFLIVANCISRLFSYQDLPFQLHFCFGPWIHKLKVHGRPTRQDWLPQNRYQCNLHSSNWKFRYSTQVGNFCGIVQFCWRSKDWYLQSNI